MMLDNGGGTSNTIGFDTNPEQVENEIESSNGKKEVKIISFPGLTQIPMSIRVLQTMVIVVAVAVVAALVVVDIAP